MNEKSSRRLSPTVLAAVLTVMVALSALAFTTLPLAAQEKPAPPPISSTELTTRSSFTDDVAMRIRLRPEKRKKAILDVRDPSSVAMAEIVIQPGARFPWHTHPGPVIATVKQGALVYIYSDDCKERRYAAGSAFIDPGYGNIHTAYNPTDEVTVVMATFLDAPATGPLTIASTTPPTLPKGCNLTVGAHSAH